MKMKNLFKKEHLSKVIILCMMMTVTVGCWNFNTGGDQISYTTIYNDSELPVHLFEGDEGFSPSNKVQPGDFRKFKRQPPIISELVTIPVTYYAGRNGEIIDKITVDLESVSDYTIRFNGSKLIFITD